MKLAEVKKSLISGYQPNFKALGFKKWKYGFVKEDIEFQYLFGLACLDRDTTFPCTFYIRLSSRSISNVLKKIIPFNEDYAQIFGLGQQELFEKGEYTNSSHDICNEYDVKHMIDESFKYFNTKGFPLLLDLSDLKKIEVIINSDLNAWKRNVGIILARLVDRFDFNILVNKYRNLILKWNEVDRVEFEKIVSFLEKHTVDEIRSFALE